MRGCASSDTSRVGTSSSRAAGTGTPPTSFQRSQDTLYTLGADTGGKALLDFNDLSRGLVQAQQAITSYYILGYYTTNTALDGKFRRIKITLKDQTAKALGLTIPPSVLARADEVIQ